MMTVEQMKATALDLMRQENEMRKAIAQNGMLRAHLLKQIRNAAPSKDEWTAFYTEYQKVRDND